MRWTPIIEGTHCYHDDTTGEIVGEVDEWCGAFTAMYGDINLGRFVHVFGAKCAVENQYTANQLVLRAKANGLITEAAGGYFYHGTPLGSAHNLVVLNVQKLGLVDSIAAELSGAVDG
jgi:hypothetical protein